MSVESCHTIITSDETESDMTELFHLVFHVTDDNFSPTSASQSPATFNHQFLYL